MIRMNQRFRSSKIQRKEFFFRVKEELGEWHEKRVKYLFLRMKSHYNE